MRTRIALALSALGLVTSGAAFAVVNIPALANLVSDTSTPSLPAGDLMDVVSTTAPEVTMDPVPEPSESAQDDSDAQDDDAQDDDATSDDTQSEDSDDDSDDADDDDESDDSSDDDGSSDD